MARTTREVVRVISTIETMKMLPFPGRDGQIELRQQKNGEWAIYYPDEGFIPCELTCKIRHKHDRERGMTKSSFQTPSRSEALSHAKLLAEGRDVKIFPWISQSERMRQGREAKKTS